MGYLKKSFVVIEALKSTLVIFIMSFFGFITFLISCILASKGYPILGVLLSITLVFSYVFLHCLGKELNKEVKR